jgi:hypothetical protein
VPNASFNAAIFPACCEMILGLTLYRITRSDHVSAKYSSFKTALSYARTLLCAVDLKAAEVVLAVRVVVFDENIECFDLGKRCQYECVA